MTPAEVLRDHISELEADYARTDKTIREYNAHQTPPDALIKSEIAHCGSLRTRIAAFQSAVKLLEKAGH